MAGALVVLLLLPSALGQTLSQGKTSLDASDYTRAASIFATVRDSGMRFERPRAAVEVLRAWNLVGREDRVAAEYDKSLAAARGTEYEPQCMLERGKSLQLNAHDTTGALALYAAILSKFPSNGFSASGALYQRGLIELDDLKTPTAALTTFQDITNRYTLSQAPAIGATVQSMDANASPYVDDALVAQSRAAVSLGRLDVIDEAQRRLRECGADAGLQQKAQLQRAEFMSKVRVSREYAIKEYTKAYREYTSDSEAAAIAKIRAADLVPEGDFRVAIGLYDSALNDSKKLSANLRSWARLQTGIYQFQVGDEKTALATFQELRSGTLPPAQKAEVEKYITGLIAPDSTESLVVTYDRGIRRRQTGQGLDEAFCDMQRVIQKSSGPRVAAVLSDKTCDREVRAQMRYRKCFALFFCGRGKEAIDLAQSILDEERPEGVTKWECVYMRAFLLGRAGDWGSARAEWQKLMAADPPIDFLPQCYVECSRAQHLCGDVLGAVLTLDELTVRFPERVEAETAGALIIQHLSREPELNELLKRQKPTVAARWQWRDPALSLEHNDRAAAEGEITNNASTTGGAE